MIEFTRARSIADAWIAAWNAGDIETLLSLYRDDAEHTSPLVVRWLNRPNGTVRTKNELRGYFSEGLRRSPDLNFELIEVFAGVSSITIIYGNHRKQVVAETLVFDEQGKIGRVFVNHRPS